MHRHRLLTLLDGAASLADVIGPGLRRPANVIHGGTVELVGQPHRLPRPGTGLRVDVDAALGEPHDHDPLGSLGARVDGRPLSLSQPRFRRWAGVDRQGLHAQAQVGEGDQL
ncbi:hypothetical protein ABZ591_35510, partial [Micromonospora fulviviridis]|uniref:hypothetical protein n=1 Tax=Micromonospora fulviviridis TaxID=47860 RepID=UPI0034703C6A